MKNKKTPRSTPSLLESRSSGGETAQKGFIFQDGVLLSQLPKWLAHEGFTTLIRESMGDTEVKFFIPGQDSVIDFWETKDHPLTPSEFWDEIARFKEIHAGSPHTYRSFTLASVGLSANIKSIETALRRVRNPYEFYGPQSPVIDDSYQDFEDRVVSTGHLREDARFLFDRVLILSDFGAAHHNADGLFRKGVDYWLPEFRDLRSRDIGMVFTKLQSLVKSRLNSLISRKEIEAAILEVLGQNCPPQRPISIRTSTAAEPCRQTDLCLDWGDFFGGENRQYPSSVEWNTKLLGQLRETHTWILRNRSVRRIHLSGNRRLSSSLAIGSVFSAVSGFAIDLEYRDETWSTDAHPDSNTPAYEFATTEIAGNGSNLVVVVGLAREILADVKAALTTLNLGRASILHLHGTRPVISSQQVNAAVGYLKQAISKQMTKTGASQLHLFFSGPSHLALFLGHRLNATAPVQCYEWTGGSTYVPTCKIYVNG